MMNKKPPTTLKMRAIALLSQREHSPQELRRKLLRIRAEQARKAASLLLSLGKMTLPHELARVVLLEQLYRAFTILKGHPYHLGH